MGQGVTGRARASRLLIGVCCALAVLLAVMAVMQYRWATLVADGEARRTKAALDTAASLFARDFDRQLAQIYIYLQNGGARAVRQRAPFTGAPPLIRDFYYVEPRETGFWIFQRIGRDGKVSDPTADPDPAAQAVIQHYNFDAFEICASTVLDDIPAVVAMLPPRGRGVPGAAPECLVAWLDAAYLRDSFIPEMVRRYLGGSALDEVDFAVVRRTTSDLISGRVLAVADVTRPFFQLDLEQIRPEAAPGFVLIRP